MSFLSSFLMKPLRGRSGNQTAMNVTAKPVGVVGAVVTVYPVFLE
jgi:hypothetical protein